MASTGGIMPDGDPEAWHCYERWRTELSRPGGWWQQRFDPFTTRAGFWYLSKHPPHNSSRRGAHSVAEWTSKSGTTLRHGSLPSFHVNVPSYVLDARLRYLDRRLEGMPRNAPLVIVTHGFTSSASHYLWGWSALTSAELPDALRPTAPGGACLYLRRGQLGDYLWPLGGSNPPVYLAGTGRVVQHEAKSLAYTMQVKYERWRSFVSAILPEVELPFHPDAIREGWRPVAKPGLPLIIETAPSTLTLRPQGGSGLRLWWLLADALTERLDLDQTRSTP